MSSLIRAEWPAPESIKACNSCRQSGVSQGVYRGLNLAHHVGDRLADVQENRSQLQQRLGLTKEPFWLNQTHGNRVVESGQGDRNADAVYTTRINEPLAILTADCLPVLITDRAGTCVGAAHAGWRGLANGVIEALINAMPSRDEYLAWLGPCIGPCHYQVGIEVADALSGKGGCFRRGDSNVHVMLDLCATAREQLNRLGIDRIYGGEWCTHCNEKDFYSFRRDGVTGRLAALIWISC